MPYYALDNLNALHGPVQLQPIPGAGVHIPAGIVSVPQQLPAPAAGKAWVWDGAKAVQIEDNRGLAYRTADGTEVDYQGALGPMPADLTRTPRPSADHVWADGGWAFSSELQSANRQAQTQSLCNQVDQAADIARRAVAGDPLRAVEYDRAATEAHAYVSAGYQGEVPPMVAAWAINGRTAQQAADDILREAAQYNGALVQLRATRLQAKELIRQAMANGNVEQAQDIAVETIAAIEAAVAGIGNNA
jgi:hypothetical protein